jgi:hypothetical protein
MRPARAPDAARKKSRRTSPRINYVKLSAQDTERFYRIWWALLRYVNAQHRIGPDLPPVPGEMGLKTEDAHRIRQVLWASEEMREAFVAENPAGLPAADLALAASWRDRVAGQFFILRHLKKYSIFLAQERPPKAYGVLGLVSSIQEIVPSPALPVLVEAVLLPFEGKIVYDSLLTSYPVTFGSGIRRNLNDDYRQVQERGGVTTSLEPRSVDDIRQAIRSGNGKVLEAFRKDLAASGLSSKMAEQHAGTIATFTDAYLSAWDPPRSLLDLDVDDLQRYQHERGNSSDLASFKRLVRFLRNTGRIDWDDAEDMKDFLKQRQRETTSKS